MGSLATAARARPDNPEALAELVRKGLQRLGSPREADKHTVARSDIETSGIASYPSGSDNTDIHTLTPDYLRLQD